ncbi:MAG TPA: hypothetical protein VKB59_22810, partial [Micromonosporaceae bacterium]|nr:hypothetical protein [Micromonosporaceae bacterium]
MAAVTAGVVATEVALPGAASASTGRTAPPASVDKIGADVGGTTAPDFGPNVFVFDASTPAADIQARFDALFAEQASNQFGTSRYAVLFKPGAYNVDANLGYYT